MNNDEICLGFHTYTYKFQLPPERVPNLVVETLRNEEGLIAGSPNSFDENGVSDEVLNNLADDIFNNAEVENAIAPEIPEQEQENIEGVVQKELANIDNSAEEKLSLTQPETKNCNSSDSQYNSNANNEDESNNDTNQVYEFKNIADPLALMLEQSQPKLDVAGPSGLNLKGPVKNNITQQTIEQIMGITQIEPPNLTPVLEINASREDSNSSGSTVTYNLLEELPVNIPPDNLNISIPISTTTVSAVSNTVNTVNNHLPISVPTENPIHSVSTTSNISNNPNSSCSIVQPSCSTDPIGQDTSKINPINSTTGLGASNTQVVTDSVERFKIHFNQTLDEVAKKYSDVSAVSLCPGTSSVNAATPSKVVTLNQPGGSKTPHTNVNISIKKNASLSSNLTASVSLTSPTNANKKIRVMASSGNVSVSNSSAASNHNIQVAAFSGPVLITMSQLQHTLNQPSIQNIQVSSIRPRESNQSSRIPPLILRRQSLPSTSSAPYKIVDLTNTETTTSVSGSDVVTSSNQNVTKQFHLNVTSVPVGGTIEILKSEALPVANHEVVTNNSTSAPDAVLKISPIKLPNDQAPSTSTCSAIVGKRSNKEPDISKPSTSKDSSYFEPSKGLGQSQYEEMENELMCTICANLFIKAVTLGCSHSFCQYCIDTWKKKKSDCPICRNKITSTIRTLVLDNIIEKMLETASLYDREQRNEAVKERKKIEEALEAGKKPKGTTRGNNVARRGRRGWGRGTANNVPTRVNTRANVQQQGGVPIAPSAGPYHIIHIDDSSESPSENESESVSDDSTSTYDYDDYYGDEWYSGNPAAYYGGYGRCYNCGLPGHWANGCPYR